jgi:DNA-binding transcriptional LysR family regulator
MNGASPANAARCGSRWRQLSQQQCRDAAHGGARWHRHRLAADLGGRQQLCAGALRRVLEAWQPPTSTIYAVYPGNRLMSMKVRALVVHLARCFGRTPYRDDGL